MGDVFAVNSVQNSAPRLERPDFVLDFPGLLLIPKSFSLSGAKTNTKNDNTSR